MKKMIYDECGNPLKEQIESNIYFRTLITPVKSSLFPILSSEVDITIFNEEKINVNKDGSFMFDKGHSFLVKELSVTANVKESERMDYDIMLLFQKGESLLLPLEISNIGYNECTKESFFSGFHIYKEETAIPIATVCDYSFFANVPFILLGKLHNFEVKMKGLYRRPIFVNVSSENI